MKCVLVVDSDPVMLRNLIGLLKSRGSYFHIMTAGDEREALTVLDHFKVDLMLVAVGQNGTAGLKLLADINRHHPEIKAVAMAAGASTLTRARLSELVGPQVMDEPVDGDRLTRYVFAELQIDYGGQIHGISLPSFLQMIELEGKTCTLEASTDQEMGYLFFEEGTLVHARTGQLTGSDAVLVILTWDRPMIDLDYQNTSPQRTILRPLMSLLLESRRRLDEARRPASDQRRHNRLDCLMAVDMDLSDWTYKTLVHDISYGGAYIETDQAIGLGQKVVLSLGVPGSKRDCTIAGQVVRRDPGGVGIRFEELSLHQHNVIKALLEGTSANRKQEIATPERTGKALNEKAIDAS